MDSNNNWNMEEAVQDGRYRLLRQIGGGAAGAVWSAQVLYPSRLPSSSSSSSSSSPSSRERREKVAVKQVSNLFRDVNIAKRTLREIRLLRQLSHENIVRIRDVIVPANKDTFNQIFIVYELMPTNLHKIITSPHALSDETVQLYVYQILRGLKYIHSAGVLHRDLKPTNILVNERNDLKICDFGCGRASTDNGVGLRMTKLELVATRWYRAPEGLLSSGNYTTAVDIWSVGCILAELLGRRVLFPGRTEEEQIELILHVLGTPSPEETKVLQDETYREHLAEVAHCEGKPFETMFPDASPLALDLLRWTLAFDPAKRITVNEALSHPYLAAWHREDDEPVAHALFNDGLDHKLTGEALREHLYNEALDVRASHANNNDLLLFHQQNMPTAVY